MWYSTVIVFHFVAGEIEIANDSLIVSILYCFILTYPTHTHQPANVKSFHAGRDNSVPRRPQTISKRTNWVPSKHLAGCLAQVSPGARTNGLQLGLALSTAESLLQRPRSQTQNWPRAGALRSSRRVMKL